MQILSEPHKKVFQVLLAYSDAFNVPRHISVHVVKMFMKMCDNNGYEFAVLYFKELKLCLIKGKNGIPYTPSIWVKRTNTSGYKGAFGALYRWCSSPKSFSRAIRMIQIYTTIVSPETTEKQKEKFLKAVTSNPVVISQSLTEGVVSGVFAMGLVQQEKLPKPPSLIRYPVSPLKRSPHANGRTYPEDQNILESMSFTRCTNHGWSYSAQFAPLIEAVEEGIEYDDPRDSPDVADYHGSVGRISFIQEPGWKLRAVANPCRVYQCALSPLAKRLYSILPSLPWDCTHNQKRAVPFITSHLMAGKICHSVDLSSATDLFPLDLQISVLSAMFPKDTLSVRMFATISRGYWQVGDHSFVKWTKGQPLGLIPSFASFALTHGLLLYFLNNKKHDDKFFVLGDDVVILDDKLHKSYMETLQALDCPISDSKSISSSSIAEFAGMIILPERCFHSLKWRKFSDNAFVDLTRNFGRIPKRLLKPRQMKICKIICDIPDFMGGLGFNPNGIGLADRIYKGLCLFQGRESAEYIMSVNRRINSINYYESPEPNRVSRFRVTRFESDQDSISSMKKFLPTLVRWYEISGRNLFDVNPSLGLPISGSLSSLTTLERLERQLLV